MDLDLDLNKLALGLGSDEIEIVVTSTTTDDKGFNIQSFFDGLYESKRKGNVSRTVLFDDDNSKNNISKLILSKWSIVYDKHIKSFTTKTQKKQDTAIDQGGPSRQFLTDVFKQIDSLSILVENEMVKLFINTSSGVMVTSDDKLNSDIETVIKRVRMSANKQAKHVAIERAKHYVRAIGRIMLHALANRQTLPTNALPPFFINCESMPFTSQHCICRRNLAFSKL